MSFFFLKNPLNKSKNFELFHIFLGLMYVFFLYIILNSTSMEVFVKCYLDVVKLIMMEYTITLMVIDIY